METGTYISGIAHAALIVWALIGGFFLSADDATPVAVSEVSLITGEQFAALTLPETAPDVSSIEPVVSPPVADDVPEVTPNEDAALDKPAPAVVEEPEVGVVPDQPLPDFTSPAELVDDVPVLPEPPSDGFDVPVEAVTEDTPKPLEAPRIAPEPAAEAPPGSEIADTATPEVVPDAEAEVVAEDEPAAAPEEATTEIVTEAETPARSVMTSSKRPISRPPRPVAVPEESSQEDSIADALAAAVAQPEQPARDAPTGPPLTGSETEGLRVAVSQCWNTGALSSDALRTTVVVAVSLSREGKPDIGSIRMLSSEGGSDAAVSQAFEAARRAIIRCGAKGFNLPGDKYSQWQDIEMTFNPEKMRFK